MKHELPKGWAWAAIGEISLPRTTWNPKTAAAQYFDYIDIESVDNLRQRIDSPKHLPVTKAPSRARVSVDKGDILFSLVRPYLKNIALVPETLHDEVASTAFVAVKPAEGIEPSFVFHQLIQDTFIALVPTYGNSPPAARDDEFLALHVAIAPTAEQRRISEKLDELLTDLDAGVAALKRARANLKRYRAAVLKAAVEGKLTAEWRKTNPPSEPADKLLERILVERRKKWEDAQLAKYAAQDKRPPKGWKEKYAVGNESEIGVPLHLPEAWCWSTLGECFEVAVGATPSRAFAEYWNGTIPWVSSGEVQFCRIKATREHISEAGLRNSSTRINRAGSVVLGMIGEGKTRGQAAILDIDAANNQNCAAIHVSLTPVFPEFVYYWLSSRYEETRTRGSGNNQPALNKNLVQKMPMPLAPVKEQAEIVRHLEEKLSAIDAAEREVTRGMTRAQRLRQAILKRAFEGKLVSQDPNDEPASVLLERIQGVRTAAQPAGKHPRKHKGGGEERKRASESNRPLKRGKGKTAQRNVFAELSEGFDSLKRERDG